MPRRPAALLLLLAACGGGHDAGARPNVLIVVADDLTSSATGTWARGEPLVDTPGIDALAARGVRFERALCASPFCTPSRQSFLTGRWPHSIRVTQLFSRLHPGAATMATVFREQGYATAAVGKMHWYRKQWEPGTDYGFDHLVDRPEWQAQLTPAERAAFADYNAGWSRDEREEWSMTNPEREACPLAEERQLASFLVQEGLRWIDAQDGPWLCFLSLYEPHAPFPFPPRLRDAVDPAALALHTADPAGEVPGLAQVIASRDALKGPLTEAMLREMSAAYLASVLWLDEQVAAIDAHLAGSGRYDDTVVVFWSDNGYFLGEHGLFSKNYPYRETIEVPLAIAAPGLAPRDEARLVHAIDVFPTLCDLTGVAPPALLEGRSLHPILRGEEGTASPGWSEFSGLCATLQDERWKLFLGQDESDGWDQLYDLEADPRELENLIEDPASSGIVAGLTNEMWALLKASPPDGVDAARWLPGDDPAAEVRWALSLVEDGRKPPAPRRKGGG